MLFSSTVFIFAFLPATLILYFLIPAKHVMTRNVILLVSSLIFYGWGEPRYIFVMLISIILNYFLAILIEKNMEKHRISKLILILDVFINIGLLGYFKYTDFIINTINTLSGVGLGLIGVALPIGISFYTFQAMSYVIDVYRGKVKAQNNPLIIATYITLFPQLIAGPIVRYSDVESELLKRTNSSEDIANGIRRFIIGFSKKLIIANQMAVVWDEIYGSLEAGYSISSSLAWIGAFAFTFQIYFDFSGYSDMAIGLGKIFGFNYLENFNYPYISRSITEFWRRWHISLSSWFKEYVYIPLGGNRKGLIRQLFNIMVVWALTGLWHGASWNFVLWGIYYGVLLILEKVFLLRVLKKLEKKFCYANIVYTMFFVALGWVIFNITDFDMLKEYVSSMFDFSVSNKDSDYYLKTRFWLFIIAIISACPLLKKVYLKIIERINNTYVSSLIETIVFLSLFIISICFLISGTYNPFLYFRF